MNTRLLLALIAAFVGASSQSYSMPASDSQATLALARRLVVELHLRDKAQDAANLGWEPVKATFLAGLGTLPDAAQEKATATFKQALEESHASILDIASDRFAHYYAAHVAPDHLRALVEFYASPSGRRLATSPDALTAEDKNEIAQFAGTLPGALEATVASVSVLSDSILSMEQNQQSFALEFKGRLCLKLKTENIPSPRCLASAKPLQPAARTDICGLSDNCGGAALSFDSREAATTQPSSGNVIHSASLIGDPQDAGVGSGTQKCTVEVMDIADLAKQNGYRYASSCL